LIDAASRWAPRPAGLGRRMSIRRGARRSTWRRGVVRVAPRARMSASAGSRFPPSGTPPTRAPISHVA
jgi:hypothetical protein